MDIWGKHSIYADFGFAPSYDIMNKVQTPFLIPAYLTFLSIHCKYLMNH